MAIQLPFGFAFRDYQQPIWNEMVHNNRKRAVTVWPRRNGKDICALNIVVAKALQRRGLYFYIAPYYTQVRSIIWKGSDGQGKRFLDYIPKDLVKGKNEAHLTMDLINGSTLRMVGSDNIDSIVGNNPVGVVFTEFSIHKPEVWHYIRPILAENGGWALFNGTPRGLNHFYTLFENAKRDPNWFCQYLTREDTGIPSLEAIEEDRLSGMPESLIDQEYFCSWTSSSEETLIPLDIIEVALRTRLSPQDFEHEPRIMGVDVAYAAKGDEAIIAKRQGRLLHPLMSFKGMDNMTFASKIATEANAWQPQVIFIDAGRGEGVISRLFQLGFDNVVPVHFSGAPSSELYQNKRAEIWCRMRDWFMTGMKTQDHSSAPLIPDDGELIADLSAPTFEVNERGYIVLEPKKAIKKRLTRSTDRGDAAALTFGDEVEIDETQQLINEAHLRGENIHKISPQHLNLLRTLSGQDKSTSEYDVLNYLNHANEYGDQDFDPTAPQHDVTRYGP